MPITVKNDPIKSDVLHSETHSRLTAEEVARAVARHNREHPKAAASKRPRKTTPRG